jgi:hypothetical protein
MDELRLFQLIESVVGFLIVYENIGATFGVLSLSWGKLG